MTNECFSFLIGNNGYTLWVFVNWIILGKCILSLLILVKKLCVLEIPNFLIFIFSCEFFDLLLLYSIIEGLYKYKTY